ncbi:hypothetical protein ACEQ8H_008949 [Pleosporales sp. CAS-2024a]
MDFETILNAPSTHPGSRPTHKMHSSNRDSKIENKHVSMVPKDDPATEGGRKRKRKPPSQTLSGKATKRNKMIYACHESAIQMSELARAYQESNPNIKEAWVTLGKNNIVKKIDQPSRWNKSSVNASAIRILNDSNVHFDDQMVYTEGLITRLTEMSRKDIKAELSRFKDCLRVCKETRSNKEYTRLSERMASSH